MISKIIVATVANIAGLYLIGKYVPGAHVPLTIEGLLIAAFALTLINLLIRPILKLIFSPLIAITLGLATLIVNGITLYILELTVPAVSFGGLTSLVYATLITTAVNFVVHVL
jgi:putative membrane protein